MTKSILPWLCLFATLRAGAAEGDVPQRQRLTQYMPIFVPEHAPDDADYTALAAPLKTFFAQHGVTYYAQRANRNPNCCFFVELWKQDASAYVLRVAPYGYHLTAGSPQAVKRALERLKVMARQEDGITTYPLGIYSNIPFQTIGSDGALKDDAGGRSVWPAAFPVVHFDADLVDNPTVEMKPELEVFSKEFGFGAVKGAGVNPEHCLWIESWPYNPRSWVLRVNKSAPGGHLVVGSTETLREALAFIRKNAKKTEQGWALPVGNFANLKVQDTD